MSGQGGASVPDRAGGLRPEPAAQSQPVGAHPSRVTAALRFFFAPGFSSFDVVTIGAGAHVLMIGHWLAALIWTVATSLISFAGEQVLRRRP